MNTNELLAAGPVVAGAHGQHIGIGLIVLALLVLGALGYGAVRLTHRVRFNRQPRPVTRPEPPRPESERPSPGPEPPSPRPAPPRPNNGWAVETHGLSKRFGPTVAVDDVELLVPRGSAFGYLGPNGAGKTTLIRTLLGLTRANAGTMSLLGTPRPGRAAPGPGPGRGDRRRAPLPPAPDRPGQPGPADEWAQSSCLAPDCGLDANAVRNARQASCETISFAPSGTLESRTAARLTVKVQSSSYERYPAVRYAGISSRRTPSREAGSLPCPWDWG